MNDNEAPHYVSSPFFRRIFEERAVRDEISAREYYFKKGFEEGLEEARQEAREEGSASRAKQIASRMLQMGADPQLILEATELDQETLNELRASLS